MIESKRTLHGLAKGFPREQSWRLRRMIDSLWREGLQLYTEQGLADGDDDDPLFQYKRNEFGEDADFAVGLGHAHLLEQDYTTALGGYKNTLRAHWSTIIGGRENTTTDFHETILGSYATVGTGLPDAWRTEDRLLTIGNGVDSSNRSAAWTIYKSGFTKMTNGLQLGEYDWGVNTPQPGVLQYTTAKSFEAYHEAKWWKLLNRTEELTISNGVVKLKQTDYDDLNLNLYPDLDTRYSQKSHSHPVPTIDEVLGAGNVTSKHATLGAISAGDITLTEYGKSYKGVLQNGSLANMLAIGSDDYVQVGRSGYAKGVSLYNLANIKLKTADYGIRVFGNILLEEAITDNQAPTWGQVKDHNWNASNLPSDIAYRNGTTQQNLVAEELGVKFVSSLSPSPNEIIGGRRFAPWFASSASSYSPPFINGHAAGLTIKGSTDPSETLRRSVWQLAGNGIAGSTENELGFRTGVGETWGDWYRIWHSGNLRSNLENDARYLQLTDSRISNWNKAYENISKIPLYTSAGYLRNEVGGIAAPDIEYERVSGNYIAYNNGSSWLKLRAGFSDDSEKLGGQLPSFYAPKSYTYSKGEADNRFFRLLPTIYQPDLDTAQTAGFRKVQCTGSSIFLMTMNVGSGSARRLQLSADYANNFRIRTTRDDNWNEWFVLLHTGNHIHRSDAANDARYLQLTDSRIPNWQTAYGWGNHAGLYRPISWVPSWTDVTGKPIFATVATSGNYNDLSNKPSIPSLLGYATESWVRNRGYLTEFPLTLTANSIGTTQANSLLLGTNIPSSALDMQSCALIGNNCAKNAKCLISSMVAGEATLQGVTGRILNSLVIGEYNANGVSSITSSVIAGQRNMYGASQSNAEYIIAMPYEAFYGSTANLRNAIAIGYRAGYQCAFSSPALFGVNANATQHKQVVIGSDFYTGGILLAANTEVKGRLRASEISLGNNSARWTKGEGSPEGVVEDVKGSLYSDTNGSGDAILYVKTTGGKTGWKLANLS